jgi:hypothetical protein
VIPINTGIQNGKSLSGTRETRIPSSIPLYQRNALSERWKNKEVFFHCGYFRVGEDSF